jgi:hypothetical protein
MRETVGKEMGVKAAGGIRSFKDAIKMLDAGADRWAQYSDSWMQEDRPCWDCPSRQANLAKQPKEVYVWYKERCLVCPDRAANVFND